MAFRPFVAVPTRFLVPPPCMVPGNKRILPRPSPLRLMEGGNRSIARKTQTERDLCAIGGTARSFYDEVVRREGRLEGRRGDGLRESLLQGWRRSSAHFFFFAPIVFSAAPSDRKSTRLNSS